MPVEKTPANAFYQWQNETVPRCYAGPHAERYLGTVGPYQCHWGLEGDTLAMRARFITNRNGPVSALRLIGDERKMGKYASETRDQYRARLQKAFDIWAFAGTPHAITSQLELLGYEGYVVENWDWDWDGDTSKHKRFWVVITGHPFSHDAAIEYDDGSLFDDGHVYDGLGANTTHLQDLWLLIRQWKPAHAWCSNIIVVTDPVAWAAEQPDGTWGDPQNRSAAAVYWGQG